VVILTQYRETRDHLVNQRFAGVQLEATDRPTGGIAVETIHRYKGLEADAVIVILDRVVKDRDRALAYIGLSRARAQLVVIGPPAVGTALGMA
jgi:superfamily I DNA/RNA helicase